MGAPHRSRLTMLPELLLVLLGAALRLTFVGHTEASYDLVDHQVYIEFFRDGIALPPIELSRLAYGPPLYHLVGGLMLRVGAADWHGLIRMSALLGTARLLLLWWGLRVLLPGAPLGRWAALALAAVLPAAVHIDGMVNNESLSMLLCWSVMACWLHAHDAPDRARLRWYLGAGVLLALALLTKFSGIMLVIAALGAAVLEVLWNGRRRAWAWLACAGVACALAGPYYLRNLHLHGRLFPTAFEAGDAGAISVETRAKPLHLRRPPEFFWKITPDIYSKPYYPHGNGQFFSTLLAVTYSDHSAYYFSPRGPKNPPEGWSEDTIRRSGRSVAGGTVVSLFTVIGLGVVMVRSLRRRDPTRLALLGTAVLAVLGQLYFATQYPVDHYGVIKATYLQFGAAPLYVCFGAVVAWAARRGVPGALLAAVLLLALAAVAAHTLTSRLAFT